MNTLAQLTLIELRQLVNKLGDAGGTISASIYDTAQLLRYYPPKEGAEPALKWLISQQKQDGGWGNPNFSHIRFIPTLAAILAIHQHALLIPCANDSIQAGILFLQRHAQEIDESRADLPVGAELILPKMLYDAEQVSLPIDFTDFKPLLSLGNTKLQQINAKSLIAATPPIFSWEAWGHRIDTNLIDPTGGIGHSPSATAYWLYIAQKTNSVPLAYIARAQKYLKQAEAATGLNIPGVVPTAWPITRFEQSYALEILSISDLLDHPLLQDAIAQQVHDLALAMRPNGLGFSDYFLPDVDDTAAAINVLSNTHQHFHGNALKRFENGDHFATYPGELQFSISATARGILAKQSIGQETASLQTALVKRQSPNGRWQGDKWNFSWLYSTLLAIVALKRSDTYRNALQSAVEAIQCSQNEDGGWGIGQDSSLTDTFYGALALHNARNHATISLDVLMRAYDWLKHNHKSSIHHDEYRWLNKQEYSPHRVDCCYALCILAKLALDEEFAICTTSRA